MPSNKRSEVKDKNKNSDGAPRARFPDAAGSKRRETACGDFFGTPRYTLLRPGRIHARTLEVLPHFLFLSFGCIRSRIIWTNRTSRF